MSVHLAGRGKNAKNFEG